MKSFYRVLPMVTLLASCGGGSSANPTVSTAVSPSFAASIQPAMPGYTLSVFAAAPTNMNSPDEVVATISVAGGPTTNIFVAYQNSINVTAKGNIRTGSTATVAQGQLVEYDLTGKLINTWNIPGHIDGVTQYSVNNYHTLWVTSNEDGNAQLSVVDFSSSNTVTTYMPDASSQSTITLTDASSGLTYHPLNHGGGLDDLKVINNVVYVSASSPGTTNAPVSVGANNPNNVTYSTNDYNGAVCGTGVCGATALDGVNQPSSATVVNGNTTNTNGAIQYQLSLNATGQTFHVTPVVSTDGLTTPTTIIPGTVPAILNATDADSTALDLNDDLWINSQNDGQLIHVMNIGVAGQSTAVLPLTLYGMTWVVDDVRWIPNKATGSTGNGFIVFAGNNSGTIYRLDKSGGFSPNTVYASGGGMILSLDPTTGNLSQVYLGFGATDGLDFVNQ